jgi:hypothetical protein
LAARAGTDFSNASPRAVPIEVAFRDAENACLSANRGARRQSANTLEEGELRLVLFHNVPEAKAPKPMWSSGGSEQAAEYAA